MMKKNKMVALIVVGFCALSMGSAAFAENSNFTVKPYKAPAAQAAEPAAEEAPVVSDEADQTAEDTAEPTSESANEDAAE